MRINIDDTDLDDGLRYLYEGELFTGEMVETDPEGNVIALTTVRDGIPHGPSLEWYADGTRRSESDIVDGKATGISPEWHPNGRLAEEREFTDDGRLVAVRRWDDAGTPLPAEPGRRSRHPTG